MGAPSPLGFNLDQTFFGFKAEDQVQLHDNLYELIWAGDGRWDWDTIYNLPLHIRRYWVTKINKLRDAQATAADTRIQNNKPQTKQPSRMPKSKR